MVTPNILIVLAALCGFSIAFYIHHKKKHEKPMTCPLRGNCHEVVHSEYSKFLGIPLELLGMVYYALIALTYISPFYSFMFYVTAVAFLFSLYLTFIQLFVIRQICTWCFVSAGLCTLIFILAI